MPGARLFLLEILCYLLPFLSRLLLLLLEEEFEIDGVLWGGAGIDSVNLLSFSLHFWRNAIWTASVISRWKVRGGRNRSYLEGHIIPPSSVGGLDLSGLRGARIEEKRLGRLGNSIGNLVDRTLLVLEW